MLLLLLVVVILTVLMSVRPQVINSNMEPPGNNNCEGFQMADHGFEVTDSCPLPAACCALAPQRDCYGVDTRTHLASCRLRASAAPSTQSQSAAACKFAICSCLALASMAHTQGKRVAPHWRGASRAGQTHRLTRSAGIGILWGGAKERENGSDVA